MSLAPTYAERAATEALSRGNAAEAERLLREGLKKNPNDYRSLVMIAHILREKGDSAEAATFAERAAQLLPNLVEAHFQLGLSLLELGRNEAAAGTFGKAVTLRPEIPDFHMGLGTALEALGQLPRARRCFEQASKLRPQDFKARLSLASIMLRQDDLHGARFQARAVTSLDPSSVPAHLILAEVAMVDGQPREGEEHIRCALAADPHNYVAYAFLGHRLSHAGNIEEAEKALRHSIELNPNQGFSYLGLVQARKTIANDPDFIARMEEIRDRGQLASHEMSSLHFALGKSYEANGDFEKAMASYDDANKHAYAAKYGDRMLDEGQYCDHLKAIRALFPWKARHYSSDSDLPIFIVGMMRSGTTLTEQIVSSHPDVAGAGEVAFWLRHAEYPQLMAEILGDPVKAKTLVDNYIGQLRRVSPDARHVTDKLPTNYQRLGLLRELFPKAKIIHCKRNPIDTGLSMYLTPNRTPQAGKRGIVFNYRQYQEMMRYWSDALPSESFLDVQYEDLVSDPEPSIRRILDFCGLDWNENCLHPEMNTKDVSTPSLWQVRRPIYRSSIERWKQFEPWLGELRELL